MCIRDRVEWVHAETLVHSGGIGQEASQGSLKDNAKVHHPVAHALLEDRKTSGLTDDQISPLDDNNGDKEGSVASVLQALPVMVGPFLSIGVSKIIDSLRIPEPPQSQRDPLARIHSQPR